MSVQSLKIELAITVDLTGSTPSASAVLLGSPGAPRGLMAVSGPQLGPGTSNLWPPGGAAGSGAYDPGAIGHVYAWCTQQASGGAPAHWTEDWIRKGAGALPWDQGWRWAAVAYDANAVGGDAHRYGPPVESRLRADAQAAGTAPWQRMNLDIVYESALTAAQIQARYPATLGNNASGWAAFDLRLNGVSDWGRMLRLRMPSGQIRDLWVFTAAVPRFVHPNTLDVLRSAGGAGAPPGPFMPQTWLLDALNQLGAQWTFFADTTGAWFDL